jgi:ubiquinone/menaquinone biosynthesis C-methylase UbiE
MKTNYEGHDHAYRTLRTKGAVGWDKTPEAYAERERYLLDVLEEGQAPASGKVLELGCGAGNTTLWLAERGYETFGIDISPTAIEWAREKVSLSCRNATFVCGNVLDLEMFNSDTFDFVFDGHCFHCIIGADRSLFLSEAYRVLKPGAYLLIDTMCGPVTHGYLDGYDTQSKCTIFQDVATRYFGSKHDIEEEVNAIGFQILSSSVKETMESHSNMVIQAIKPNRERKRL